MNEPITPEDLVRFWNNPTGFNHWYKQNDFLARLAKELGYKEMVYDPNDGAERWSIIAKVDGEYTFHYVKSVWDDEDDARTLLVELFRPRFRTQRPGRHDYLVHGGYNSQWIN